jgi:hypothetical protein
LADIVDTVASKAAPVGKAEDATVTDPVLQAVILPLSVERVASRAKPVMAAGGVRVVIWAAGSTTGKDAADAAWPNAGTFPSIELSDAFPVVCKADVEAPDGSGSEAAVTAMLVFRTLTGNPTELVTYVNTSAPPNPTLPSEIPVLATLFTVQNSTPISLFPVPAPGST